LGKGLFRGIKSRELAVNDTEDWHPTEPLAFPPTGRSLLDLILLAIIDGHPMEGDRTDARSLALNRNSRLVEVKRALFGVKAKAGNVSVPDQEALIWIADKFEAEKSRLYKVQIKDCDLHSALQLWIKLDDVVEIAPLARLAAEKFFPKNQNAANRLEKKFRKRRHHIIRIMHEAGPTDEHHLAHAIDICKILQESGVKTVTPKTYWE
jgi:hypothetical protein